MTSWPDIPYDRWQATGSSLHMWAQIVGKFRLAGSPWLNHAWQATLYVTGRGLTTSLIHDAGGDFEVEFDLLGHQLIVSKTDGQKRSLRLEPMSVMVFYEWFLDAISSLGATARIHPAPNEVPDPVPFVEQTMAGVYDPDAAGDFWRALVRVDAVFNGWRTGFLGKSSPVHLFWGALDLAVTRFSGRPAPLHPGGIPALPDAVTREAYSHEVSSAGFWPGGNGVDYPAFYSYAYPTPPGFSDAKVLPEEARFDPQLGEFVLPYDVVRTARDPEATLMTFLGTTYAAAADLGKWDRPALECEFGRPQIPRHVDVRRHRV
jgi:hypothetical protein